MDLSPTPPSGRNALRAGLCVSLLALLAACSEGSGGPSEAAIDLLARQPDSRHEQPGLLTPVPGSDWGHAGRGGWARLEASLGWTLEDGSPYIEANQPTCALALLATDPRPRVLEMVLWRARAAEGSTGELRLALNGIELPTPLHPGASPATHRVEVPAELWRAGENRLEFRVDPVEGTDERGRHWDTLAVASVRYDGERLVDYDATSGRCTLPSTGGVRWCIEAPGGGVLELAGRAAGPGRLSVRFGTTRADSGRSRPADDLTIEVVDGFERTLALPVPSAEEFLYAELEWHCDSGATLDIEHARVGEAKPHRRPNVVLISIDTYSARHLSVYGYDRRTTPRLEEFAEDAVLFEHCVANAPWTLPSYLSALTGLYPGAHLATSLVGDRSLDNFDYWQVAENRWTLAEALRARGYQTAAALDTAWLSPRFRIDQGFDLYDLEASLYPFNEPEYGIRYISWRFQQYLDSIRRKDTPFFAFMHALDAHGPYWPEEGFLERYRETLPDDLRPTPAGSAPQTFGAMPTWMAQTLCPPELRADVSRWPIPDRLPLEKVIERYDEAILKTDHYIGEILDSLRERGLYDDALIVVTADHGESFAHGVYSHGVLWEDVIEIPLLIKFPGGEHGGRRVPETVQLVDLYPTLLEEVGAGGPRAYLHGTSLRSHLAEGGAPEVAFCEGGIIDQRSIEAGGFKLIESRPGFRASVASLLSHPRVERAWLEEHVPELARTGILTDALRVRLENDPEFHPAFVELSRALEGPFYALFDLTSDPDELHDLAEEQPEKVRELLAILRREKARAEEARELATPTAPPLELSREALEQLQRLGYTGEEGGG
ncbi:MAG TPA: hypothetical protein ENJ09_03190 [Planctomycetes bacterium]|nr:hypothetical protein [Planctomycetota bacterium]